MRSYKRRSWKRLFLLMITGILVLTSVSVVTPINADDLPKNVTGTSVKLSWKASENIADGSRVSDYDLYRNGSLIKQNISDATSEKP